MCPRICLSINIIRVFRLVPGAPFLCLRVHMDSWQAHFVVALASFMEVK